MSTLLLDKTGTITLDNREAAAFVPLPGIDERQLADASQLSSPAEGELANARWILSARRPG